MLWELRAAFRAGDVCLETSRRYANPDSYLISPSRWPRCERRSARSRRRRKTGQHGSGSARRSWESCCADSTTCCRTIPARESKKRFILPILPKFACAVSFFALRFRPHGPLLALRLRLLPPVPMTSFHVISSDPCRAHEGRCLQRLGAASSPPP